jgi:hypothetical protein
VGYLGTATQPKPDGTRTEAGCCFVLNGPIGPWHAPHGATPDVIGECGPPVEPRRSRPGAYPVDLARPRNATEL